MFKGINVNETKKITLKSDPDPANPTVFHIGVLDQVISGYIEDESTRIDVALAETSLEPPAGEPAEEMVQVRIQYARRNLLIIKFGVRKIENYFDPKKNTAVTIEAEPVKIYGSEYMALPDEMLRGFQLRGGAAELAEQIRKINGLSEDEAKN